MNDLTEEIILKPIETLKVIKGDRSEVRPFFTLVNVPAVFTLEMTLNDVDPLKKSEILRIHWRTTRTK